MNPRFNWMLWIVVALVSTGCVSQRVADDLQTLNRRNQEQILELQARLEDKQAEIEAMRSGSVDPSIPYKLAEAEAERARLQEALALAEEQLRSIGSSTVLEPEIDTALVDLARSNPGLISYDPGLGMVKFQSDLTFELGSADVNDRVVPSLQKFAKILNTSANNYEARIVGHTDNVPVNRPSTKAKHPTNWHLSVHRAISVKNVLAKAGVDPTRIGVAGYGEHRPISTSTRKGNQENRRVEIFLVPNTYAAASRSNPRDSFPETPGAQPLELPIEEPEPENPRVADAPEMFK